MSESILKHAIKTTISMICFALIGTALLVFVFQLTRDPIAQSEAEARLDLFKQVLPENTYNNAILESVLEIPADHLLGNTQPTKANIARMNQQAVGVILEAVAHDGYSGDIKLLIAIREDGSISGVRTLSHKETPGLGDYIDIQKDGWITLFDHASLSSISDQLWRVKKDGGQYDYKAGATITPRAVVNAVHKALQYFEKNKLMLLNNGSK